MTARALQRMIHVGCRELGLDADTRRDLQLVATGKASMAEMSEAELAKLLEALKARGFKPGFKPGVEPGAKGRRPAAPRPDLRYIHVLWGLLGKAGALKKPGRDGLNAFLRTRFEGKWGSVPIDIDALRDAGQINDVTRALKDMCRRAGVDT
ncbi:regulatory protein GemA [Cereibacter changlensis JA139]|uniref:Regulatory protein GemA n=2 Tax=Cereibacter changlensis TaxID=402884 RepID=A0A2T4JR58_9RHOB|nr:regulatory protein GemA [Cereibacter changlensis]PTE20243.1 regulatory protein GemA [Cereibacter changlensis JA139]PZX47757.1 uncharacterized protein DUF1018 [Cereibacter changlensis]